MMSKRSIEEMAAEAGVWIPLGMGEERDTAIARLQKFAELVLASAWTSVANPPEGGTYVLASYKDGTVTEASYDADLWLSDAKRDETPIGWKELPQPMKVNFMTLCLAGKVEPETIGRFVEGWRKNPVGDLHEHLGMTDAEYAKWVIDPGVLDGLIAARRSAST